MKKWIKLILISLRNTVILLIILEIFLYFLFQYNDNKRFKKNVDFKIASGAYQGCDPEKIKALYGELYQLDSEWTPFLHFRLKEFKGVYHNINSKGIRYTDNLSLKKQKRPLKIFCMGGSTTLGTGARDENTIPSRLAKYIHEHFPNENIEITNFGCHGYSRSIENIQLQLELLKNNKPDIVIFYDGVNEIISAQENKKAGYPTNAANRQKEFKMGANYTKKLRLLFSSSKIKRFITYLQRRVFKTKSMEVAQPEKLSYEVVEQYTKSLKITKALSAEYNFTVYNFLQPVIYINKPLSQHEEIMAKENEHFKKLYHNSYELIQQKEELKQDSTYINISNIFKRHEETIYTDFCHISEKGNDIIAQKIFSHIVPSIKEKEPKILE